jgi:proteasome accessory factor B
MHYVDLAILADELASFGPEVLVIEPPELRAAVIERLQRTVADHG